VAQCKTYGDELLPTLATMFEQLGGIEALVADKVVGVKINLVSSPWTRLGDDLPQMSHCTHPAVIAAVVRLIGAAGARKIRILECCGDTNGSFEDHVRDAGWNLDDIRSAAPVVEFENTNFLGSYDSYEVLWCPQPGHIFPGFQVNRSYKDCDVLVSVPKMKEHKWFGVTLSMKNIYGITPLTVYGDAAGIDEPSTVAQGTRVRTLHEGGRAPSLTAPQELYPDSPRAGDYRIPRIVADINTARPVHFAVIDGIESMAGGEGPWAPNSRRVSPRLLVAGFNPLCTDAVAMALMGFNPLADRGEAPFEGSDSHLRLGMELGIGTADLSKIEVRGVPIEQARFNFRQPVQPAGGDAAPVSRRG
jgi:uncharacterized protein (DUF362 family)